MGSVALVAAATIVAVGPAGSDRPPASPSLAEVRDAAQAGLETLRVDTDPREGDAVDGALARHLAAELDFRLSTHCRQMGRPAGPYHYYCDTSPGARRQTWWVTYEIGPRDGSVRVHGVGQIGYSRPT